MKSKREKILSVVLPIISLLCIVLIWTVAALAVNNEYVLPSVTDTLKEAVKLLGKGSFYIALFNTLIRSLIAFLCSFILAFLLAVSERNLKYAKYVIKPLTAVLRALPTIAVVLLLLFWTSSYVAPVIVTMLVVLPTLYNDIRNSLFSVDKKEVEMCRFFGVSERDILFKVQLPQITPPLLLTCGAGLSLNLKLMVAAEVLSATARSLGVMLSIAKYNVEISNMIAIVLVTVIIGLIIEWIFSAISKKAGKWQ